MFADLCILSFNSFSKLISTIYFFKRTYNEMIQETQSVFKSPGMRIYLVSNKSVCIYDNKHASKQISWIDEFQNEKDIQLSLVNIMSFVTGRPCYTGYKALARSIR